MTNETNECNKIEIAFLEKKDAWQLHSRFFPSKVGGKPAWLDLENLPHPRDLLCNQCADPMVFLCQIYAPYEESEDCFHRTLFIFLCRNGSCCKIGTTDNIAVFRCQLPQKNKYYSFKPYAEDENEQFAIQQWTKMCKTCGNKAPSHCAKCKNVYYCSRKHQVLDWQKGHKQECDNLKDCEYKITNYSVTKSGESVLFEEWELIDEEEDVEESSTVNFKAELEKMNSLIKEKKVGTLNNVTDYELDQYTGNTPKDKVFSKFSKRVSRHPDQVLRYNKGGEPLWITEPRNLEQIPKCQYCNGERHFEYQIMPQLLNFINVGVDVNSIDWGILAVYTCKNSCNAGPSYKQEYIIKQDLST